MVEEFGVTDCTKHFGKNLACMDRVAGVVNFQFTLLAIVIAFYSMKSFGLVLTRIMNMYTSRATS
jgi:hypothetical protein